MMSSSNEVFTKVMQVSARSVIKLTTKSVPLATKIPAKAPVTVPTGRIVVQCKKAVPLKVESKAEYPSLDIRPT